jgi:hypothetical protein
LIAALTWIFAGLTALYLGLRAVGWCLARKLAKLKIENMAAVERLRVARAGAAKAISDLAATQKLFATYNLKWIPPGAPCTDLICCTKIEPCARHTPQ